MVVSPSISADEQQPLAVGDDLVEWVDQFSYIGPVIADEGSIDADVDKRRASTSKAFGVLRQSVFSDRHLSVISKCHVYQACVLPTLLHVHGSECWTPLHRHLKRLDNFHHWCIKVILGIYLYRQQWEEHITLAAVRRQWG